MTQSGYGQGGMEAEALVLIVESARLGLDRMSRHILRRICSEYHIQQHPCSCNQQHGPVVPRMHKTGAYFPEHQRMANEAAR